MSCKSEVKPLVAVITPCLEPSFTPQLTKVCPAAKFVCIPPADVTPARLQDAEILIVEPSSLSEWINHLPNLKWLFSISAGVDKIFEHWQLAEPPSFALTRLAGVLGPVMGEYVVGHIIGRERQFSLSWTHQQTKTWPAWASMRYRSLSKLTIGILGCGDVGREVAKYCKSMKMRVNSITRRVPDAKCPYVDECFGIEDLPICLNQCDYLCNLLPSTPKTKSLLSGNVLENCKEKQTIFINIGRGDVLSHGDILKALDKRWIGGAILDVFEKEPLPKDSELWSHPRVTITPHISGSTSDEAVINLFLENFNLYQAGKPLKHTVDWRKGY